MLRHIYIDLVGLVGLVNYHYTYYSIATVWSDDAMLLIIVMFVLILLELTNGYCQSAFVKFYL
jgi:hypothetical protein